MAAPDGAPAPVSLYGAATPAVQVVPGALPGSTGGRPAGTPPDAGGGDDFGHWSEAGQIAGALPPPQQADAPAQQPGAGPGNSTGTGDGDFVFEPPEPPRVDPRAGYAPAGGAVGGGRGNNGDRRSLGKQKQKQPDHQGSSSSSSGHGQVMSRRPSQHHPPSPRSYPLAWELHRESSVPV